MRVSADWRPADLGSAPELDATIAELSLRIAGKDVGVFVDRRDVGPRNGTLVVPAYPLAEGLARHWWWLVGGRPGVLRLTLFREGYALPDVRISLDGRSVTVQSYVLQYDNPPVVFFEARRERLSPSGFADDVDHFVTQVLDRLSSQEIRDTGLAERWSDIRRSGRDPDERSFCLAAGALGIDPYLCSDEQAAAIGSAGEWFEGEPLFEFLAGHSQHSADRRRAPLGRRAGA